MKNVNMKVFVGALTLVLFSSPAFCLERTLPLDASNVVLSPDIELSSEPIGATQSHGSDEWTDLSQVRPVLIATVTYDSEDTVDVQTELDPRLDIQVPVGGPTIRVTIEITEEEASAIRAGTLEKSDLLSFALSKKGKALIERDYSDCSYSLESNELMDPDCVQEKTTNVLAPTLVLKHI